jgi:HSP20 family protein
MFGTLVPWMPRFPRLVADVDDDFGRMMNRFFGAETEDWGELTKFTPRVDVAETKNAVEVTVELPGMKAEDFHVEMHENGLWITGEKKEEKEEKGKTFHRIERRRGEFKRLIPLPVGVNRDTVEAEFKDGLLHVTIGKMPEAAKKEIPVKA